MHFVVLLYGLTAILGELIQLPAVVLVWWRVLITSISFLFFIQFGKAILILPKKIILKFLGIGSIVGFHWICFYGSIKFANASVALVAMATTTFFTSLIEPILFKRKLQTFEIVLSLILIPGMMLVVTNLNLNMRMGLWIGLLSAFLAALFSILNKKYLNEASEIQISFLEIFGAFLLLSIVLPFYLLFNESVNFFPAPKDWGYLLILSLLCTTLTYYLSLIALRKMSAFESNLIFNLEPVYGIALAIVLLSEHQELSSKFYYGVAIILLSVFIYPILQKRSLHESI